MKINIEKPLTRGKKIITILVAVGLIAEGLVLAVITAKMNESDNIQIPEISTIQNNSIVAVSNPTLPPNTAQKLEMVITAYSSTTWQTDETPFITASGKTVTDGIIANNLLPFGTKVRIPEIYGDKVFVVEDRMHTKNGNYHVDIWFPSYWQAKSFGKTSAYIEILEN